MQQRMEVITLGNGSVNDWPIRDLIALDNQNLLEVIGQHTRRDQTGDAAANDNRLLSGSVAHAQHVASLVLGPLPSPAMNARRRMAILDPDSVRCTVQTGPTIMVRSMNFGANVQIGLLKVVTSVEPSRTEPKDCHAMWSEAMPAP